MQTYVFWYQPFNIAEFEECLWLTNQDLQGHIFENIKYIPIKVL